MEVSLIFRNFGDSALFKQVFDDISADYVAIFGAVIDYLHVLPEAAAVIVSHSLGIAEGLQNGVALQYLLPDVLGYVIYFCLLIICGQKPIHLVHFCQKVHGVFGVFCFPGA